MTPAKNAFVKVAGAYTFIPSLLISNSNFVSVACRQGAKSVLVEYLPCLRISRLGPGGLLRFEYRNDTGRKLASALNRRSGLLLPSGVAHIFIGTGSSDFTTSTGLYLLGAWTTNQKPVGVVKLVDISDTLHIPVPTLLVRQTRQTFAAQVLKQVENSDKVCFFHGITQSHVTKASLAGVGLCTLSREAIRRIPIKGGSETLAWIWLEYLAQNERATSEKVDCMVKDALLYNEAWLVSALKIIGKE